MRIHLLGDTARECYLAEMLRERGHMTVDLGPFDLVILPLPRGEIAKEHAEKFPAKQKIICGLVSEEFKALAKARQWALYPILQDEAFTQENALLSAEGAVYAAMRQADFSLHGASCAVIGYGRIGKALTKMLRGLGACVTVAARREESRKEAGSNSVSTDELHLLLPQIQILFNTVPAPLIDQALLSAAKPNALFIELASPPYGIDLSAAQQMGLRAWLESGIPGRYCPQSAAKAILGYIERSIGHG
ncbi:MAG: hypothetical protein E7329_05035 [Clostridiales bacterium]|nr:hypothetical protein [Clostridiales bacterium]